MIRVLQIVPSLSREGLQTFIMNVYRTIDRSTIQFDFLTRDHNGDYAEEIRSLGGKVYEIQGRKLGYFGYQKAIRLFFKQHAAEYSAVHMHLSLLFLSSILIYPKQYGIKVRILHSHSSSFIGPLTYRIAHYLEKPFVRYLATDYFGCSDKAIDWMYKYTGVRKKAIIVKNGIDAGRFKYNLQIREKVRNMLSLGDCQVLGHVGRFSKVKNHEFIIDVFNSYHNSWPNSKLVLVGDGELMPYIKQKAKSLGLGECVIFLGSRRDISEILQALDFFIMPSLYEGLPVSLVEAQCSGLPILASDTISSEAKLTDNLYFYSLENSPDLWAERVHDILEHFTRRDTSRIIVNQGFDIGQTTEFLKKVYTRND
jgi:glycosyltransferase involved in cell wall biosynthesis